MITFFLNFETNDKNLIVEGCEKTRVFVQTDSGLYLATNNIYIYI